MDVGDLVGKLPVWLILAIVAAPGVWAVVNRWIDLRKQARVAQAALSQGRRELIKIAQDAAGEVIEDLRAENARVRDRLAEIEREFGDFRRMHDSMIADKDAKIALLEEKLELKDGEARQWRAAAESYERQLTQAGVDHVKLVVPFVAFSDGHGQTMGPLP